MIRTAVKKPNEKNSAADLVSYAQAIEAQEEVDASANVAEEVEDTVVEEETTTEETPAE